MLEEKMSTLNSFVVTTKHHAREFNIDLNSIYVTQNYFADKLNEVDFIVISETVLKPEVKVEFELLLGSKFLPYTVKYMTNSEFINSGLNNICTTVWHS